MTDGIKLVEFDRGAQAYVSEDISDEDLLEASKLIEWMIEIDNWKSVSGMVTASVATLVVAHLLLGLSPNPVIPSLGLASGMGWGLLELVTHLLDLWLHIQLEVTVRRFT